jgi:hypothetical protein
VLTHLTHRAGATLHTAGTLHAAGALLLHGVPLLLHRVLAHLTHRAGATLLLHRVLLTHLPHLLGAGAVLLLPTRSSRQLRCATRQLGRAHLLLRHLLLHRLGSGYGGGDRTVLLLRFAHVLLLLVRSGGTSGRGQLGPQVLVLAEQSGQFRLHLVEEGVDLILVIALSEADGRELLVPNVLGGQRHLFTST